MINPETSKSNASDSSLETQSNLMEETSELSPSVWKELYFLAMNEKRWWIVPILISLALIAIAAAFGQSTTVPFIYRLY